MLVRSSLLPPSVACIGREICLVGSWNTGYGRISLRVIHKINQSRLRHQTAEQFNASVEKHMKKFRKWLDES